MLMLMGLLNNGEMYAVNVSGDIGSAIIEGEEVTLPLSDFEEITQIFNWNQVMREMEYAEDFVPCGGDAPVKEVFVGTVFSLTPSRKYYMPWCSNYTEAEANADTLWWEMAEKECAEHNCYLTSGEGDPCDLFIGMVVDSPEEEPEEDCGNCIMETITRYTDMIIDELNCGLQGLAYQIDKAEENEDDDGVYHLDGKKRGLFEAKEVIKMIYNKVKEEGIPISEK